MSGLSKPFPCQMGQSGAGAESRISKIFMHRDLLAIESSSIGYRSEIYKSVILGTLFKIGIVILRVAIQGLDVCGSHISLA